MEPTTEQLVYNLQDELHDLRVEVIQIQDTILVMQDISSNMLSTLRIVVQKVAEQRGEEYEAPKAV